MQIIPCLRAKVIDQEETEGKYGPGIHNHIMDVDGNVLILTTWRTHMKDLKIGKTYHLYNVKVDHFTPHDSWYDRNPDVRISQNRHHHLGLIIQPKLLEQSIKFESRKKENVDIVNMCISDIT